MSVALMLLWCVALVAGNADLRTVQRRSVMYPGTKWCGKGNVAEHEDDLGEDSVTDACCRDHDMCPDCIQSGETKHGLTNTAFYTRVHCSCDEKFYNCLLENVKSKNSSSSSTVGYIYFTRLKNKCFMEEHPILGCKTYTSGTEHCEEYLLDAKSPPIWQWFDVPLFP